MGVTTECIAWAGTSTDQYGYVRHWVPERKKVELFHRWAVASVFGWDAIEGKTVMHACDNPSCYALDHLVVGTQVDNMIDAMEKGRAKGWFVQGLTHCHRNHEFTEANTYYRKDRPGQRECRKCRADATARYNQRRRSQ